MSSEKKHSHDINNFETENEAEAKSKSRSFALNINWNILYYPSEGADGAGLAADPLRNSAISPDELLSKIFEKNESEAVAVSKSEAEIRNNNINVVVEI